MRRYDVTTFVYVDVFESEDACANLYMAIRSGVPSLYTHEPSFDTITPGMSRSWGTRTPTRRFFGPVRGQISRPCQRSLDSAFLQPVLRSRFPRGSPVGDHRLSVYDARPWQPQQRPLNPLPCHHQGQWLQVHHLDRGSRNAHACEYVPVHPRRRRSSL